MISLVIICIDNKGQNATIIFNILDNTTEFWMTNSIIGEIFSSGGATLYKNPSDQTVITSQQHEKYHYFKDWDLLQSNLSSKLNNLPNCSTASGSSSDL